MPGALVRMPNTEAASLPLPGKFGQVEVATAGSIATGHLFSGAEPDLPASFIHSFIHSFIPPSANIMCPEGHSGEENRWYLCGTSDLAGQIAIKQLNPQLIIHLQSY